MTALVRLYPRAWRDRYEAEFLEVLAADRSAWRTGSTSCSARWMRTSIRRCRTRRTTCGCQARGTGCRGSPACRRSSAVRPGSRSRPVSCSRRRGRLARQHGRHRLALDRQHRPGRRDDRAGRHPGTARDGRPLERAGDGRRDGPHARAVAGRRARSVPLVRRQRGPRGSAGQQRWALARYRPGRRLDRGLRDQYRERPGRSSPSRTAWPGSRSERGSRRAPASIPPSTEADPDPWARGRSPGRRRRRVVPSSAPRRIEQVAGWSRRQLLRRAIGAGDRPVGGRDCCRDRRLAVVGRHGGDAPDRRRHVQRDARPPGRPAVRRRLPGLRRRGPRVPRPRRSGPRRLAAR